MEPSCPEDVNPAPKPHSYLAGTAGPTAPPGWERLGQAPMGVQNGGDIEGPEAMEEAACLTTRRPPALMTQRPALTIILIEDGGAVIQHFVILFGHQLALTVVEQQWGDLLIQLDPVGGPRLFLGVRRQGEGKRC